jgi:very-short-patch-repair endonuclease/predicted transcriptional regulator of viral defense system
MGHKIAQDSSAELWALAARQHGVVARTQLLESGLSPDAIKHRVTKGRLHPVRRGVYAVGRPRLTRNGTWMAAVLGCGPEAALSHTSAAALWEIRFEEQGPVEVSLPARLRRRQRGIIVHRRVLAPGDVTRRHGIPVTAPACTLLDLASRLGRAQLEAAINEADKRDLIDPGRLRSMLERLANRPGIAALRETLDRQTFALTDSELERRFLPLARRAGLPAPLTRCHVSGFRVDFYWPDLGLVVETDGLRYHRTPAAQARDRLRDQTHAAAGLTPLRFTHAQVEFEPGHVEKTLAAVAARLRR